MKTLRGSWMMSSQETPFFCGVFGGEAFSWNELLEGLPQRSRDKPIAVGNRMSRWVIGMRHYRHRAWWTGSGLEKWDRASYSNLQHPASGCFWTLKGSRGCWSSLPLESRLGQLSNELGCFLFLQSSVGSPWSIDVENVRIRYDGFLTLLLTSPYPISILLVKETGVSPISTFRVLLLYGYCSRRSCAW